MWMAGVGVLVVAAAGGGVAVASNGRSGDGPASGARLIANTATSNADKTAKSP
jgi:hypothetical protein